MSLEADVVYSTWRSDRGMRVAALEQDSQRHSSYARHSSCYTNRAHTPRRENHRMRAHTMAPGQSSAPSQ